MSRAQTQPGAFYKQFLVQSEENVVFMLPGLSAVKISALFLFTCVI